MFFWSSHIKEHRARARPSQPDHSPELGKPTTAGHPRIYQTLTKQRGNLGGPFTITAVDPGRRWVSACPVPLGTITFEHLLEPAAAGYVKVIKRADVQGGTGPLLRLLAPRMRRDTAASFAALEQRACHQQRSQ